ncbi:MAG: putative DNA ligase [Candidatus Collierbacteria bacterium GW2011_GWB1_45_35]|uniref:DNA ligase n=2 Tax=Candidatus Collieribacteriota TaxID=1752725 RepID=A0A0G1KP69_9BACT|nr:MAG: putative DNA ligase [Microgenomates group bacterium GW2011_GWC1_44_23]KKT85280.1 MAG: putative DNA ligase [Candidatus Collierbacteria bacterium GW2011_GWA2_44_99]KKT95585.1 MAG: putative DNA ligase [Candidatus Collierbacteria bacterium GW2011_GWA1_45_15]KKU00515.1 MAG: putative DNA ligase [Candidatus Collierbacteria bacterium GW2011_GWB2_45_17]KKU04380.1 MAG: putative DNA ligase [Candidatus Collierbacteria bacterium GW2011_GWB1_45_35]KKU08228.1 MAG: putative DNA ligase [Candidatus Coll
MLFKEFADYLEKLEKISSRLEITKVLAELIEKMKPEETDKGIYLTLGQLGPDFDNKEFNMAVKMVLRSVVEGSGLAENVVEKKYKAKGDVGLLMEELEFKNKTAVKYSINEVFEKLKIMAEEGGNGSQERKVARLTELLLTTLAVERKFIARMVLGKLRLGFSEKTIFDALSQMTSGGKTLRKGLDNAFQLYPDPGFIAKVVKEKGIAGLKNIKVKTGVPVVSALCQRLNNYQEIVDKMGEVAVERKFDGTRVQIHFKRTQELKNSRTQDSLVKTYTRNLEESSPMFPELFLMKDWIKADEVILDCEAVGYDRKSGKILPFQLTITRKRKHDVAETAKSVPLKFFVFDILSVDGKSLVEKPYFERRIILTEIIKKNDTLVPDEYFKSKDALEIQKLHDKFLEEGFEGAVIKQWSGEYLPGRQGWNWVKIKEAEGTTGKLSDTFDLVILGYYLGRGKRTSFGIGAFLAGIKKDGKWVSIAKVGTGLTDEEFRDLKKRLGENEVKEKPKDYLVSGSLIPDVWVEPMVVVEVAADEITKSPNHAGGVALRFPRLVKFREDKSPKQSTTWKEVLEIASARVRDSQ